MIEFLRGYQGHLGDWLVEMSIASLGTLQLMIVSFCLACAIGLVIALLRMSALAPLNIFARIYIGFFRGVPVLVILYWIYFALPEMGYEILVISSYTAAVLGLGIHGGAFLAEVFRSGIESLHPRQGDALDHPPPGPARRGAADRQLCRGPPQGNRALLDHRSARADAPRQGSGLLLLPADACFRLGRDLLLHHELPPDARRGVP
jgi:His/Glu/Gln/Arg/opine family amino acid ABC transporter permease subunit